MPEYIKETLTTPLPFIYNDPAAHLVSNIFILFLCIFGLLLESPCSLCAASWCLGCILHQPLSQVSQVDHLRLQGSQTLLLTSQPLQAFGTTCLNVKEGDVVTAGNNVSVKVNDQCFSVPEVLEPPALRFGAWQPPVSSPLPVYLLQTPSDGWPAPPAGRCDCGGFRPVHLPSGSAEPSHHVPTKKHVFIIY